MRKTIIGYWTIFIITILLLIYIDFRIGLLILILEILRDYKLYEIVNYIQSIKEDILEYIKKLDNAK